MVPTSLLLKSATSMMMAGLRPELECVNLLCMIHRWPCGFPQPRLADTAGARVALLGPYELISSTRYIMVPRIPAFVLAAAVLFVVHLPRSSGGVGRPDSRVSGEAKRSPVPHEGRSKQQGWQTQRHPSQDDPPWPQGTRGRAVPEESRGGGSHPQVGSGLEVASRCGSCAA